LCHYGDLNSQELCDTYKLYLLWAALLLRGRYHYSLEHSTTTLKVQSDVQANRAVFFGSALSQVVAFNYAYRLTALIRGQGSAIEGMYVSGGFFGALGISPATGRLIGIEDDREDAAPVAVTSFIVRRIREGIGGRLAEAGGSGERSRPDQNEGGFLTHTSILRIFVMPTRPSC
jgi:hypothetical protein